MKKKGKLIAYFNEIQITMLYKDSFLIPYHASKRLRLDMEVWSSQNQSSTDLPSVYKGVPIYVSNNDDFSKTRALCTFIKCILCNLRQIEAFFIVNIGILQYVIISLLRLYKPKIKIIIMGDLEPQQAKECTDSEMWTKNNGIKGIIRKIFLNIVLKRSVLCVAQGDSYRYIKSLYNKWGWNKVFHMYPCLDDEAYIDSGIEMRTQRDKENIFLYVGRIGNYQKNTDMILDALSNLDMKDWKFYLIGPITDSFRTDTESSYKDTIDNFFKLHPEKKNNVIFTGPIYDTNMIFDYYNRAKVFVLTSRHESFANVLSEAAAFGCYFISTDVGGAPIVTNNWKFGTKVEQEDSKGLANAMKRIIDGSITIEESNRMPMHQLLYSKKIDEMVKCLEI